MKEINLTRREIEVIKAIWDFPEATIGTLGEYLSISPRTINNHLTNSFNKTHFQTRLALIKWALQHNLIELEKIEPLHR